MAEEGKNNHTVFLKSDDVTGQYKQGNVVILEKLPAAAAANYKKAYNRAWNVNILILYPSMYRPVRRISKRRLHS